MIEVKNISKTFVTTKKFKKQTVRALKDVSFTINDGEAFGLLGNNGAGKTTLQRIMATLITPDSGDVIYSSCTNRTAPNGATRLVQQQA